MTKKLDTTFIQIVHPVCCGLDVHKKKISACLITIDEQGKEQYEIKEFGTFTNDLFVMRKWLTDNNCPIVAMESTGVYWRPVHNVLEGFMEVILVNARHIKNVPGRKTDISDCKWLAGLLNHGLPTGFATTWKIGWLIIQNRRVIESPLDCVSGTHHNL